MRATLEGLELYPPRSILSPMSQAFVRESAANALVRSTRESASNTAEVYRTIEPDYDFEVRAGRGGYMIARLKKDGSFESWVEE